MNTRPIAEIERSASGYAHADYAASLSEFGTPRFLPNCGAWILERAIPDSDCSDAMGCYPLFTCQDWSQLRTDLDTLGKDLVCISLVTDPFGEFDPDYLRECFPDVTTSFKEHFVVDLSRPLDSFVHSHHRRNARRALAEMSVEKCANPENFLEDWTTLYSNLVARHDIKGISTFSQESFARQLRVPGILAFRAVRDSATVGMVLWYAQDNRAYYHLGAYSETGYDLRASFALFNHSLDYFALNGFKWLNLGAGAGAEPGVESGLSRFKQGWSTDRRMAYFCGRIFDRVKYDEIVSARKLLETDYFPSYRRGEFD